MVEQLRARYAQTPREMLVDGGFAKREAIEQLAASTTVYAPVQQPKDSARDPHEPLPGDSGWVPRRPRPSTRSVRPPLNVSTPSPALQRFGVRGLDKARSVLLWYALAHNLMRMVELAPGLVGGLS
ncbi:hypothetical protein GCM10027514_19730 [Azotobacter armeniacus]